MQPPRLQVATARPVFVHANDQAGCTADAEQQCDRPSERNQGSTTQRASENPPPSFGPSSSYDADDREPNTVASRQGTLITSSCYTGLPLSFNGGPLAWPDHVPSSSYLQLVDYQERSIILSTHRNPHPLRSRTLLLLGCAVRSPRQSTCNCSGPSFHNPPVSFVSACQLSRVNVLSSVPQSGAIPCHSGTFLISLALRVALSGIKAAQLCAAAL